MSDLATYYRLTAVKNRRKIPDGLDGVLYRLFGRVKTHPGVRRGLMSDARKIQKINSTLHSVSDRELKKKLLSTRDLFRRKKIGDDVLYTALALVHEASFRTLGLRPFTVQSAGALALLRGFVAEMETGEGKTLTAAQAAVIQGWSSFPCHVVTANDYLAERDAQKLESLYKYCGVSVGHVISTMKPQQRKKGYACDVTYTTAKEVAADFLRDRIALGPLQKFERRLLRQVVNGVGAHNNEVVMRGLHAAIVDEADCLLIDEAVTPLIISQHRENEEFNNACIAASQVAAALIAGTHYTIDYRHKDLHLRENLDFNEIFKDTCIPKKFSGDGFRRELLRQALMAREFFHKDKQYVIQDDKVVIVDEFTGRIMPERSWSEGLHQMVEAKEGVPITPPNETLARISFQRYFRFYHHLSGMTGTAQEAMGELWQVYDLPVVPIPRNKPCRRISHPAKIYPNQQGKWKAILDEIEDVNRKGRPVLVGTRSVELSEKLAGDLKERGLTCRVINAVRHKEEAAIVSRAGQYGAVTVATNMAGRGTDILLEKASLESGGLHVVATEFHESARIDRQLYGRSGRQGDPGSSATFAALDDELVKRHVGPLFRKVAVFLLSAEKVSGIFMARAVFRSAQKTAQRKAAQSRRAVQKMDLWIDDSLSFTREEVQK